jgi:uncharacterized membrane protein (UPF0127 family)
MLMMLTAGTAAWADDITITRQDKTLAVFHVEVAKTEEEHQRGLMFRTKLAPDAGMLFLFDSPDEHTFWMKDTLIPLDMLFFKADGEVVYIYPSATPKSLDGVGPERLDICAVLELGGGQAARRKIRVGDRLTFPAGFRCQ